MIAPLVSVVMPARDAEAYIQAALDSVVSQSQRPLEVVVVDDGSADATAELARSFGPPVRVVSGRFGSAAAARNEGLRHAAGELIAFLDADDAWLPGSLEARTRRLLADPGADYAMGWVTAVADPPGAWPSWAPEAWRGANLPGHLDAFLGRRHAVDAAGAFDPAYAPCEDVDWLARLKDSGARGLLVEQVCARYRLRADGTSGVGERVRRQQLLRALHASARRHAPMVSVVMPARDSERFIAEAIDSVLAQGHEPLELLVVDDGSADRTAAVARAYGEPVRVLSQEGAGQGAARNHAIARARGELVAFLDADDVWQPGGLAARVEALRSDPDLDLVFGHASQFGEASMPARLVPGHLPGALLARRSAFESVGRFREDLVAGEFVDWLARARDRGLRERTLADHVLRRRVHDANLGVARRPAARADLVRAVKGTLDRRRGVES